MLIVEGISVKLPAGLNPKEVQFCCHQLLFEKRQVIVGFSNGTIAIYRRRIDTNTLQEVVDSKPQLLQGHTGKITRLLLVREEGQGADALLISASADRTVRIWDPSVKDVSKMCIQTLRGHGGTVSAVAFCEGVLITASTDRTIKLWGAEPGRDLMLYSWLTPQQTLADLDCWVHDIALQMGENGALFVGDEHGDLSAYKVEKALASAAGSAPPVQLMRWRRQAKAHSLGITTLVLVEEEQMLITLGYADCH
jgi:WD40 repeat protein